ncbi:MAG: isochorismatase family cysteine hydrolase [Candidatus Bipolaricaulota bacterium]
MNGSVERLHPASCALLVVDMQNDFVSPHGAMAGFGFDVRDIQAAVPAIARLLRGAREAGVRVFHTRMVNDLRLNASSWTAFWGTPTVTLPGTWGAAFIDDLAPREDEVVVDKVGYGAFDGTSLDVALRAVGVETAVVVGTGPNICSGDTLHGAFARGFHVVAVSDALASFSRLGPAQNAKLKDVGLYVIANHYGRVLTSDDVLRAWKVPM